MYINKIDELIDKVMDDFAAQLLTKNKLFNQIKKETNFVKFQPQINKLMKDYVTTLNQKEVQAITNNPENMKKIVDIIKRYLAYYMFLAIGYFYTGKTETFINNIIEFTRNQPSFNYKIENFFNSENNATLINFYDLLKNTVLLLSLEPSKLAIIAKKKEMQPTIKFLNGLGQKYVLNNFKLSNLNNDSNAQASNIIKTLIVNSLYQQQEKEDVFNILDAVEKQEGNYIFIDIVMPRTQQIDFNMIEKVLTEKQMKEGMANELYEFLSEHEDRTISEKTPDQKLGELVNHRLLVPITEDFMLYHKDTEKYEKSESQHLPKSKKKEDTKIRYIVSKIDNVSEYYSDNAKKNPTLRKNLEKLFYVPLMDRRAVLMNEVEEVNIISKLHNQGRRSLENNEYYNDLMSFRQYPYHNFKEFKDHGFQMVTNETVDAIRSLSLSKENIKRKEMLQFRIASDGQPIHVVGFMLPTQLPVQCYRTHQLHPVTQYRTDKKNSNGYEMTLDMFRQLVIPGRKTPPVYWLFNPETDKVKFEKFIQVSKMNPRESLKLIVSRMYDDLLHEIFKYLKGKFEKKKTLSFFQAHRMIQAVEKRFFRIPRDSPFWNQLMTEIYYRWSEQVEPTYDEREDKFFGLFGKVIKLPKAPAPPKPDPTYIRIKQDFIEHRAEEEESEASKVGAICQHNVTWEKIYALRKSQPNQFNSLLFEFIQRYVVESHEQEYVCKSCGTLINIKKYIPDGMYDNESEKFVTFNMPMEVQLEDLPEYSKYKLGLRTIDKLVERISNIGSVSFYVGNSVAVKIRRRGVVKNVIDLLTIHNKVLMKYYRQRNEQTETWYGISRDLTNLFIFELEDSIFIYSSKERDYYKHIKHNNVVVYIVLNLLLELNKTQIMYMAGDKSCNYYWYEKVGHLLFNNLKIVVNNKGDKEEIKKYPVLCYLIYLMGCFMAKFNIWYYDPPDGSAEQTRSKMAVIIQKIFIHTFVDVLNSVLEVSGKNKENHYQYEILQTKFYLRLRTVYNDEEISKYLSQSEQKKIVTIGDKRKYIVTKMKSIKLLGYFNPEDYKKPTVYPHCVNRKYFLKTRVLPEEKMYNINNLTNSKSGRFQIWQVKDGVVTSKETGEDMLKVKLNANDTQRVREQYQVIRLRKLAERYCLNGDVHNMVYHSGKKMNVCKRCGYTNSEELKVPDLQKLGKILNDRQMQRREQHQQEQQKTEEHLQKKLSYSDQLIKQLKEEYANHKTSKGDYFHFIDQFINQIQNILGTDQVTRGQKIFLKHNAYIIDHDHHGHPLDKPIVISDHDKKINVKENHSFFKTDVIFYTNLKNGRMDVFYDAVTHVLLGYKESHRDYVVHKRIKRYIKIRYSLREKLRLLGYPSRYINIKPMKRKLWIQYRKEPEQLLKKIISDLSRHRILNLKGVIRSLQRAIYQVKYKYTNYVPADEEDRSGDMLEEFRKRLQKFTLKDADGKHKVYKRWREMVDNLYFYNLDKKVINLDPKINHLSIDELSNYDYHGNLLLYYIVTEMSRLLKYNPNKVTSLHLIHMLVDLINHFYDLYNEEELLHVMEMKRFQYKLQSQGFQYDVDQQGHGLDDDTSGPYGEQKAENEQVDEEQVEIDYDNQESMSAIDAEGLTDEPDYEGETYMERIDDSRYD